MTGIPRLLCACLFSLCSIGAAAQDGRAELANALDAFFRGYTAEGYVPQKPAGLVSYAADDSLKVLRMVANESFCAQSFTPVAVDAIYEALSTALPVPYNTYSLIITDKEGQTLSELIPNHLRLDGEDLSRKWGGISHAGEPWVRNASRPAVPSRGLEGRHVMIWPSHGRYYKEGKWEWQRPRLFCTTEDLFTQSFVLPYLFPMLENAGAVVCDPRERDVQTAVVVVDNDEPSRGSSYSEANGSASSWSDAGVPAFLNPQGYISDSSTPFASGTARCAETTPNADDAATATWTPDVPRDGRYAVYVTYQTIPGSVSDAHYTIYHRGGRTEFRVNQQMGGGTWVYLGTFEFSKGQSRQQRVVLSSESASSGLVTADAVRFGGGMSMVERGNAGVSGLPRFLEGARYNAQWSGLPRNLFQRDGGTNDYNSDIVARSNFLNWLGGGSCYMPGSGKGVPFELSLAIHSDAGVRADNSIYGTLSICTTTDGEGYRYYASGVSRKASADLANTVLDQVVSDLSHAVAPAQWIRREMWDRNYGESRTPGVPSIILETMSHQNYGDLKYGHDPHFKFALARSIYKGILRFINYQHGVTDCVVQPLPPHAFATSLSADGNSAELSWLPTVDTVETTATPTGYIVYTRIGDAGFDNGRLVAGGATNLSLPIAKDVVYTFRVTAFNEGGESFPSEDLSVYSSSLGNQRVLIVNGFERLSGPARIETASSLGFDLSADMGVPYVYNASYCGRQQVFNASLAGGEGPRALGYSDGSLEGCIIAGNTFDYPREHGNAIAASGIASFASVSREAFDSETYSLSPYNVIDYIAGLQCDVSYNMRPYKVFTPATRNRLERFASRGGNLLLSGSFIASDLTSAEELEFARRVLRYAPADSLAASPEVSITGLGKTFNILRSPNEEHYAAPQPDVVMPCGESAFSSFAYADGHSAGIAYAGKDYRVIAMGFPFECIEDKQMQAAAMNAIIRFLLSR